LTVIPPSVLIQTAAAKDLRHVLEYCRYYLCPPAPADRPLLQHPFGAGGRSEDHRDVRSSGTVELMGEVEGTLEAHTLTIGGEGLVNGDVAADTVEIKGRLSGQIASQTLTLRAAAQVTANIGYSTVVIESGAQIEGRFARNKD
jgi:hypothetical protein